MKIGIFTLSGENYGCQLQTYAVIKTFKDLGHDPVFIPDNTVNGVRSTYQNRSKLSRLSPKYVFSVIKVRVKRKYHIKNQRDKLLPSILRKKRNGPVYTKSRKVRSENFHNFYDTYITHADFSVSKKNLNKEKLQDFDFFSVGSDQVWNPTYPHTSELRFLTFAKDAQKLTFAPSFGISELPDYVKEPYKKWLSSFPMLSVREEQGAKLIKELTGKDAKVICDPTMTISKEKWVRIEKKPAFNCEKPYALTYFLGNETNEYRKYIDKIAKEKGLQVINLFDIRESDYYTAGPSEFIYLIHHAEAVFTDSFHAAVFSIIFKKDFVVFDRIEEGRSMGSRLKTLLMKFSLEDRMYSNIGTGAFESIDFSETDKILAAEKNKALDFLKKNINHNLNN